jgi:prolyl-tRNA synthetase
VGRPSQVSPGAKFKDADLIGVPLRIVVGRDAAQRAVEWSERAQPGVKETLGAEAAVARALERCRASGRLR